ncbi:MAG: cell division protein FtsQ/DivIB [Pseudomonadota bacterium]
MAKRKYRRRTLSKETRPVFDWREVARLLVFSVIIFAVIWVARGIDDIPIKTVEVSSKLERVDKEAIRSVTERFSHEGFFTVHLGEFEQELNEIPWVYKANIKRHWPYKLIVVIEEQQPVFRWGDKQLLNRYAIAFNEKNTEKYSHLPKLFGIAGREEYLARLYAKYNQRFKQMEMEIVVIVEDARYDKVITLSNGIKINLGKDRVDQQLERCLQSFPKFNAEDRAKIASIDLRHSNGFAVQWNS